MEYPNLNYDEMIAILNQLIPPGRGEDYDFEINTAKDTVCITAHRFNKFPELCVNGRNEVKL